ncbi:hypothetical protein OTK49_02600 [Vibrio coralliirubri]|uniref:hypothetical protein n=1 Tax=Vibrio coralliirubri TaxID=1516159 RepID=UPI00228475CF|nr:hypothetical protein [Vibrio coralliirubri]MCY9861407.1 hypothetical protein [Vibrio coralliirubri]
MPNLINAKYTKDALLKHLFRLPIGTARCVIKVKAEGSYFAKLPKHEGAFQSRSFSRSKFGSKAYSSALRWVVETGCETFGELQFIRFMYGEIKQVAHTYSVKSPEEVKLKTHYGVTNLGGGSFRGSYKTTEGKYNVQTFHYSKWGDAAFDEAAYFVELNGVLEWGASRWALIKKGYLRRFSARSAGVSVKIRHHNYTTSEGQVIEYSAWCVAWREVSDEPEVTKHFSPNKYGDMDSAGVAAEYFAAKKRAERTCSVLMLPEFLVAKLEIGIW